MSIIVLKFIIGFVIGLCGTLFIFRLVEDVTIAICNGDLWSLLIFIMITAVFLKLMYEYWEPIISQIRAAL